MRLFYHGDMDGIMSAFILTQYVLDRQKKDMSYKAVGNKDDVLIEFDYNKQDELREKYIDNIFNREDVYFVDCSPDKEFLDKCIEKCHSVFIIDHHVSRQEILEEYLKEGKIKGMFYNGASATLITYCWMTMIKKEGKTVQDVKDFLDWFSLSKANQESSDIPLSIRLVNSWDIWNGLYIDAEPYKIVFESEHLKPYDLKIKEYIYSSRTISQAIKKGNIMQEQIKTWSETFMSRFGYEIDFEGHKFYVANLGNGNSKYFGDKIFDYDAVITYCFNGELWTCSIYSDKTKDFDCAAFATRFNGGGHKKAAGFRTKELPDWLLKNDK